MSITEWADSLNRAVAMRDVAGVSALFLDAGYWRDFLALDWTLQTVEGADKIGAFVTQRAGAAEFRIEVIADDKDAQEGFISYETKTGRGRGYVRLRDGKCRTFFVTLEE